MLRAPIAFITGTLLAGSLTLSPASAESPVTIDTSGPEKFAATIGQPTGRVVINFIIADASSTATGARICRILPEGTKRGCRYQRFDQVDIEDDDDDYWDDDDDFWDDIDPEYRDWTITGAPGNWTVGFPIGYEDISREECLLSHFNKNPFKAQIEVMNDAGTVLATTSRNYRVACTGVAGNASSPDRTRVYSGRSTKSKGMGFIVLDTKYTLDSYRVCQYSGVSGRYFNCERKVLKRSGKDKTDFGWFLTYNITYQPMGTALCSYIARKWPQSGIRVEFYDKKLRKELTLFTATRLTC
jgi:hypothetical protein